LAGWTCVDTIGITGRERRAEVDGREDVYVVKPPPIHELRPFTGWVAGLHHSHRPGVRNDRKPPSRTGLRVGRRHVWREGQMSFKLRLTPRALDGFK